jgi:hypothetical protein
MANANAIVEQMKELGLRHGEKAGVAIASMAFFVCVGMAANQKTIDTTPEKIKAAATASDSNLSRQDKRETIIERLAKDGIKDSDFAKVVDEQVKTALAPDDFKAAREWVTPEPGAGLIRDTPTLIAVTELYAYPGRGGLLVYELDKAGNRVPETEKDKVKEATTRRRRKKSGGMMGGSGMMGGMGAQKKKKGKSQDDLKREAAEEEAHKKRVLEGKLAGKTDKSDLAETTDEKPAAPEAVSKEITKGYRWVVVTGVLDHAKLIANYREALKNPAVAHPNYKRLDLQRQMLQSDGSWTEWKMVSADERYKVLDNLPEVDEELTPDDVRPTNLVDPLPLMKAGLWEKVHIASLVPKEKKEIPKSEVGGGGMMGGGMAGMPNVPGGGSSMGGRMGPMMGGGMAGMPNMPGSGGKGGRMGSMMGGSSMGGRMGPMMGGGMAGGGGMTGADESVGDWRSDAKKVMIRAFDFTAAEDETYRYRVRIVVFNPNKGREDVSPGVDTKVDELRGPWSEATDAVSMPPDVMPYASTTSPPSAVSDMRVRFQVIRFNPVDGVTVPHRFDASPGEVIGDPRSAEVPVSDGTGKKSKTIDFNSRQILLDIFANKKTGGYQLLPAGFVGPPITKPSLSLVLRPDGSVVLHNEADDEANDVRKDIEVNYKEEIKQSSKKRERGTGMGMMGGGMMGSGMMGGRGGR